MSVTVAKACVRLCNYFYWDHETEIRQPLIAAATVGLTVMGLVFLLGAAVSVPLALIGAAWGTQSIALLVLMSGTFSTVAAALFFWRHNRRITNHRRTPLSLGQRACEAVWSMAQALFCGACAATIAIVVMFGVGVLLLSFSGRTVEQQRQFLVYQPIIVGIPAFAIGTLWFLIREWRFERNWLKRVQTGPYN